MAKKPLTERFIQHSVAERLNREYYRRKPAYVNTEVYTRLKRADVFLAFMRARKRPYVVVVEAKSRTTIHQLKIKDNPGRIRWAGRLLTLALIVGLSAALGYQWYFNALNTLLLLGLFVFGSWLISLIIQRLELSFLGSVGAIEQLARYPANEKWIAIGEDSIVKPEAYRQLRQQCRKSGVGLIMVTRTGKIRLKEIPRPRHTFNNYLSSYGKEATILKAIDKRPDYGPTPPEKRKFRRQLLNGALLLGAVGFLSLLTYEENYGPVVPDPFEVSYEPAATDPAPEPSTAPAPPPGISGQSDSGTVDSATGGADAGAKEVEEAGCDGFVVTSRSFIVVDALLNDRRTAARLAELSAAGVTGIRTVPTECLNSWPAAGRQALYTGEIYPNRPAAKQAAAAYREMLETKGISVAYGKAVKVRPEK